VEVTDKEIIEIKINPVPKTQKTCRGAGKSIIQFYNVLVIKTCRFPNLLDSS
jgi:hypothetical protein